MSGFMFSSHCDCTGELTELTHTKPDSFTSSCRVVCRSCGAQWSIDVLMTPYRTWTEEGARLNAMEGLLSEGAFNKTSVGV